MAVARLSHTATRLADGQVLVVGGYNRSAELYAPGLGHFSPTAPALNTHRSATATLLANGNVLVAGKGGNEWDSGISAELYAPSTHTWAPTGNMVTARVYHTATLLPDGRVLAVGGADGEYGGQTLATAELYDPATGVWESTGPLKESRHHHTATLLSNGKVLVTGGMGAAGILLNTAELYEPATGTWSQVASMQVARSSHTATLLSNGKVLVVGGGGADCESSASAELFEPATATWGPAPSLEKPRRYHSATLLSTGEVLVAGGYHEYTGILFSAELYNPASNTWRSAGSMKEGRYSHPATLLENGQLLVAGGVSNGNQASAELYSAGGGEPGNRAPVARAGADQSVRTGYPVSIDGSASSDPDGDPLTYAWALVSTPRGSTAILTSSTAPTARFTPDVRGTYVAELTVSDGTLSDSSRVTITSQDGNRAPVLTPVSPQWTVALGSTLTFSISATDPDGHPVTYFVGPQPLPPGASFDAATGLFTFRPVSANPATHSFSFGATDGTVRVADPVTVTVTGDSPGANTRLKVRVLDAIDYQGGTETPVVGASVTLGGVSGATNAEGIATLNGLPAGSQALIVRAATLAPNGAAYASARQSTTLIEGVENVPGRPILLARISGTGVVINPSGSTIVSNQDLGVSLQITQGSARNADGSPYIGAVSIGEMPTELASTLPRGLAPCQVIAVEPLGITFNPPAKLTVENRDNLPAGTEVDLWAYDTRLDEFRVVGTGKVTPSGTHVETTLGGVPGGTLVAMAPRRPVLNAAANQPKNQFLPTVLGQGNLSTTYAMPTMGLLGRERAHTLVYNSATADPQVVLNVNTLIAKGTGLPTQIRSEVTLAGALQAIKSVTRTDQAAAPGDPGLGVDRNNLLLQSAIVDGHAVASGAHGYEFLTISRFACSAVGTISRGTAIINNQKNSPFGAGWQLAELQKLDIRPDGAVVLTEGSGKTLLMEPRRDPDFDMDPVSVLLAGPDRGAIADLDGDGDPDIVRLQWRTGKLAIILNKGNRSFEKVGEYLVGTPQSQRPDGTVTPDPTSVAVGDFTGDGIPDVMVGRQNNGGHMFLAGIGGGTFRAPVQIDNGTQKTYRANASAAGDFNGDGRIDVAFGNNAGKVSTYSADAAGRLVQYGDTSLTTGYASYAASAADFDGDGFADFVLPSGGSYTLSVLYGGTTGLTKAQTYKLTLPSRVPDFHSKLVDAADIDRDGLPEIAVAGTKDVFLVRVGVGGDRRLKLHATLPIPGGLQPNGIAFVDVDKNGYQDVLVMSGGDSILGSSNFHLYRNNGDGTFRAPKTYNALTQMSREIAAVDFDSDGNLDVAINDRDGDQLSVFWGKSLDTHDFVSPLSDLTRLVKNPDGTYSRLYKDGSRIEFDANGFQKTVKDANGNETLYAYDTLGRLLSVTDPGGLTTSYTYSGSHLSSVTDWAGRTTRFEHDGRGNLVAVIDPEGNTRRYLYDALNRMIGEIDERGNGIETAYTASGQLKSQTYPDGTSVRLDVTRALGLQALGLDLGAPPEGAPFVRPEDRITSVLDAKGRPIETEVNEFGAIVRVTDAIGRVTRMTRDARNRVLQIEAPTGPGPTLAATATAKVVTQMDYDSRDNVIAKREAVGTPLQREWKWEYEPVFNRVVKEIDPGNFATTRTYDARGNLIRLVDPLLKEELYTYDARGLMLTRRDRNGNTTSYSYDAKGNLRRITDALGTVYERYHDAAGNLLLAIDALGKPEERRTSATYDSLNRLRQFVSAAGEVTEYTYDGVGNVTQAKDAAGNVSLWSYDVNNLLTTETDPATGTIAYTYDEQGNVLTETDASGAVTRYTYDGADRLVKVVDGLNQERSFIYDLADNLIALTDARGKTTRFTFDVLKRVTGRTTPTGRAWSFTYDSRDNRTAVNGPTGVFTATFDGLGRVLTQGSATSPERYTYDNNGNVLTANNAARKLTFTYDALDQRITEASFALSTFGKHPGDVKLTYTYDALGRRVSLTDSLGGTTLYEYDAEDRVRRITTPAGQPIDQTYDEAGRPEVTLWPNGFDTRRAYEAHTGRLANLRHAPGDFSTPAAQLAYSYDNRGNVLSIKELTRTRRYSYDALSRLTQMVPDAPAPLDDAETYTYDPEGNRVASHLSAVHTVDDDNRLLEDDAFTYAYDDRGNLTSRTEKASGLVTTYSYDTYDRLVRAEVSEPTGSRTVTMAYDALGRRTAVSGGSEGDVAYIYDGEDIALTRRVVAADTSWSRYTHGQKVDEPLVVETFAAGQPGAAQPGTGQTFYYHSDHQGSILALSNAAGEVVNRYDYDSYGRPLARSESVSQPYTYTGREWDADLGLAYYRARHYDPRTGRFLQEDPLWFGAGDTNVYAYVFNNPLMWRDPTGMMAAGEYGSAAKQGGARAGSLAAIGTSLFCIFNTIAATLEIINGNMLAVADISTCGAIGVARRAIGGMGRGLMKAVGRGGPPKCPGCPNSKCFVAGTLVATATGLKPIEDIAVGDEVITDEPGDQSQAWYAIERTPALLVETQAYASDMTDALTQGVIGDSALCVFDAQCRLPDESDVVHVVGWSPGYLPLAHVPPGRRIVFQGHVYDTSVGGQGDLQIRYTGLGVSRIDAVFKRSADTLIDLTVRYTDSGVDVAISGTPEHPFFVPAVDAFVAMGQLSRGTVLRTSDGTEAVVVATEMRRGNFEVYNFEVENDHNYFVSAQGSDAAGVLVHNECRVPDNRELSRLLGGRDIHDAKTNILSDLSKPNSPWRKQVAKLGSNPDIAVTPDGNLALKSRLGRGTVETDIPLSWYSNK